MIDETPTLRPGQVMVGEDATGLLATTFGLSLATALTHGAMQARRSEPWQADSSGPRAILMADDLSLALHRPVVEVWSGCADLDAIHQRLRGLAVALGVFQVGDVGDALVCLGAVCPNRAVRRTAMPSPADVWALAGEAFARHGASGGRPFGAAGDAPVAIFGRVTAQIAWAANDRLATASVTCSSRDLRWATDAICAVAELFDHALTIEERRDAMAHIR